MEAEGRQLKACILGIVIFVAISLPAAVHGLRNSPAEGSQFGACAWLLSLSLFFAVVLAGMSIRMAAIRRARELAPREEPPAPGAVLLVLMYIVAFAVMIGWTYLIWIATDIVAGTPPQANSLRFDVVPSLFALPVPGAILGFFLALRIADLHGARRSGIARPPWNVGPNFLLLAFGGLISASVTNVFAEYRATEVFERKVLHAKAFVGRYEDVDGYFWWNARLRGGRHMLVFGLRFSGGRWHKFTEPEIDRFLRTKLQRSPICLYFPEADPRSKECKQPRPS